VRGDPDRVPVRVECECGLATLMMGATMNYDLEAAN
jgi:hypothetical protein